MKKFFFFLSTFLFFVFNSFAQMNNQFDFSVFPPPKEGYVRYIIQLPSSSKEKDVNKKVEFYVGKYEKVDNCNSFGLIGKIHQKTVEGYGYSYYEFDTDGNIIGTLMYCNNRKLVEKFIIGESNLVDYNSRMPIVIDVPEGYVVQYKIFVAKEKEYKADILK